MSRIPRARALLILLALGLMYSAVPVQGDEPPTDIVVAASVEPAMPKPGDTITITTLVAVYGTGNFFTSAELVSPNGFVAKVLPEKKQTTVSGTRKLLTITTQATLREPGAYRFKYRMWVDSAPKKAVEGVFTIDTGGDGTLQQAGGAPGRRSIGDVAGNKFGPDVQTNRPTAGYVLSERKGANDKGELFGFRFETGLNSFTLRHEGGARVTKVVWTSPPTHLAPGEQFRLNVMAVTTPETPIEQEPRSRFRLVVEGPEVEWIRLTGHSPYLGYLGQGQEPDWTPNAAVSVKIVPRPYAFAPFHFRIELQPGRDFSQTLMEYVYVPDKSGRSGAAAPAPAVTNPAGSAAADRGARPPRPAAVSPPEKTVSKRQEGVASARTSTQAPSAPMPQPAAPGRTVPGTLGKPSLPGVEGPPADPARMKEVFVSWSPESMEPIGIGAVIERRGEEWIVVRRTELGSLAREADAVGWKLIGIDHKPLKGLSPAQVRDLILGAKGAQISWLFYKPATRTEFAIVKPRR